MQLDLRIQISLYNSDWLTYNGIAVELLSHVSKKDSKILLLKCRHWIDSGKFKEPIPLGKPENIFWNLTSYRNILKAYEIDINSYSNVIIKYFIPLVEDSITEITLKIHSLKKYCFRASLILGVLNLKLHEFHSRLHQTDIYFPLITYSPNIATISQWIYVGLFSPLYAKILLLSTLFLSHFMVIAFFAVASYTHARNIKGVLAVTRYNAYGLLPCIYNYLSMLI